jgi:serine/threonine-protein kinase
MGGKGEKDYPGRRRVTDLPEKKKGAPDALPPAAAEHPRDGSLALILGASDPQGATAATVLKVETDAGGPTPTGPSGAAMGGELPTVPGYEILGLLGRGAMGVVYKARQRGLDRLVALKMIVTGCHASGPERARFRGEAAAVAQLQHPNIVQVYEVGEEGARPFFSLEYVSGGGLDKKIAGTPQPPSQAAQLALLLARAIAFAHQRGIVHRDLKPANILLQRKSEIPNPKSEQGGGAVSDLGFRISDFTPKVTDFGLAKRLEADTGTTQTGAILGTPSYMSPEQAAGRPREIGPAADVYALGAILYELLTGRPPFRGASVLDTLQQVQTQEPVPPTQLQPKLPRDLETICLKCLHKEPRKRYPSALALADDLERFLAGEPVRARPVSAPERFWRWCRRNPRTAVLSAAVAALLVMVAVGSALLAWQIRQEKDRADAHALAERQARLKADRNARAAKEQFSESVQEMLGLVEQLDARLREKSGPARAGPELRAFREDLVKSAQASLARMARRLERSGVTAFSLAFAHHKMGELFLKLGQGEEALREYRKAYDLATQKAQADPRDDLARGNQARLLVSQGDVLLGLSGDAGAARKLFRRAVRLKEEIVRHPQSGYYTPHEGRRLLQEYCAKLAGVSVLLGNARAGRRCYLQVLLVRKEWVKDAPKSPQARSYLAQAYYWLGDVSWRLQDAAATQDYFRQARALCQELVEQCPNDQTFKVDLADVCGGYGVALCRLGQPAAARPLLEKAVDVLEELALQVSGSPALQAARAQAHYRLATVLLRLTRRPEAEEHYRRALALYEPLKAGQPVGYLRALARCGHPAEAARLAEDLRRRAPRNTEVLIGVARGYAVSAAVTGDQARRQDYTSRALEALRAATAGDFKDIFVLDTDPDLEALRKAPGFRQLVHDLRTNSSGRKPGS